MAYIDWDKSVEVNVPIIDEQHKGMVDQANEMYELLETKNKSKIIKIFKLLINDLKVHFDTEEKLMEEYKLPNFISHKLEHERFYNKMNSLYQNVKSDRQEFTREELKTLKIWFFNHIDFKDKELGEHIVSQKK
ncbi:MAG: bacteriohemerythrin [Bacteroidota bacterium]